MSFHSKTNYVRPHAKASYIRPLSGYDDYENMLKNSPGKQLDQLMRNGNSYQVKKSDSVSNPLTHTNDIKEKHIQNLSSAHTKLHDEIEKIQTWTTSVELECKQKNKKLDELSQIVESQRKVVLDLQMQNEKLSLQLSEEIQQRVSILEKFYFSKELCSTVRKKFNDLQGQFDICHKVKGAVDSCNRERMKAVENLSKKYDTMCTEYGEKIVYLNEALQGEKNNLKMLKDLCEQQNANAEKEHKSFCKLIENYQGELKNFSKDLEDERNKVLCLEHEKNDMLQRISDLEQTSEMNLKKLREAEEQLKVTLQSKLETEKRYASEKEKVNDLDRKCAEIEELRNKQKDEYEENCLTLKTAVNCLENSLTELKLKLEETELNNQKLSMKLEVTENEKNHLEKEISSMKKKMKELEDKLINDAKVADEVTSQLTKEKNTLDISLKHVKDKLEETLSENEKISKICLEREQKLFETMDELSVAASKIKELNIIENKYIETLKKLEEMEDEKQIKLELLASKDLEIEEMCNLDKKYTECLKQIKDFEECLQSKTEQLELKEMRIQELCIIEKKFAEAENRIQELESDMKSKNEILISKDLKIEALNNTEVNYHTTLERVKVLENDVQQNLELLSIKEKLIEDLNVTLNEMTMKLDKLEYENIEMKDNIIRERESVKVCLECEIMKDKVKEFENLNKVLKDTQKELENQRKRAEDTLKLLSETEDSFDDMRINKEKEIIKCKDSIQTLQHELRILRVEVRDAETLKTQNERLQMDIEELTLQNTGDFQRLKSENEKLKNEIDVLRTKKNEVDLAEYISEKKIQQSVQRKQIENSVPEKQLRDTLSTKQTEKSPFKLRVKNGEKMEADSSHDDEVIVLTEELKDSANFKRFSKDGIKKLASMQKSQNVSSSSEKRKRAWESESSGSECLEIVFDKDAKKLMGFTPKCKLSSELKKTPNIATPGKTISSQDRMAKRDILTILDEETPNQNQNIKARTTISFSTKRSPVIKKAMKMDVSDNMDFLSSKQRIRQENLQDSPYTQKTAESQGTPTTPTLRKFFKAPLKEREFSFKKPQLQNMWF